MIDGVCGMPLTRAELFCTTCINLFDKTKLPLQYRMMQTKDNEIDVWI